MKSKRLCAFLLLFIVFIVSSQFMAFAANRDLSDGDYDPFNLKWVVGANWPDTKRDWQDSGMEIDELSTDKYNTYYVCGTNYYGYLGLDYDCTYVIIGVNNSSKLIQYASYFSFNAKDSALTSKNAKKVLGVLYSCLDEPDSYDTDTYDDMTQIEWLKRIDKALDDTYYAFYYVGDWMDVLELYSDDGSFQFTITRTDIDF